MTHRLIAKSRLVYCETINMDKLISITFDNILLVRLPTIKTRHPSLNFRRFPMISLVVFVGGLILDPVLLSDVVLNGCDNTMRDKSTTPMVLTSRIDVQLPEFNSICYGHSAYYLSIDYALLLLLCLIKNRS